MLTKEQVESLIFVRALECANSCNSTHISHCTGQIRGLLAALTGQLPPPSVNTLADVLDAAGIPYSNEMRDGEAWLKFDNAWLAARGFEGLQEELGTPRHPVLSARW